MLTSGVDGVTLYLFHPRIIMTSPENTLLSQAHINIQKTARLAKQQKEADQGARQLFADCVETVDRYGERSKVHQGLSRVFELVVASPVAALSRLSPADFLDKWGLRRPIKVDSGVLEVKMETGTAVPAKSSTVSIWLKGVNHRLVLNRHFGYGEIYLNDPNLNEPTQHQRRANIEDITNFRQAAEEMREFIRTPVVPDPENIRRLGQMTDDSLIKELKGVERLSFIESMASPMVVSVSVLGLVSVAWLGRSEALTYASAIALFGGMMSLMPLRSFLQRRIQIIEDEIASRS